MSPNDPPDGWLPEELRHVADVVRAGRPGDDVEARVARVNTAVDAVGSGVSIPAAQTTRRVKGSGYVVAMATALVIAIVGIVAGGHWQGRTYATVAGETLHIALTDGTQVTLAPRSALKVGGNRQVTLDGEAYFTVVHNMQHPFAVRARGVITRDVGTAFDIRAYEGDPEIRVAVAEGEVAIGDSQLRMGDIAEVDHQRTMITHADNIESLTAWTQGALVFDKTPLREVVQDIERTFGVTIVVTDSTLMAKRITTALSGQPLPLVLDIVTRTIGARYEQHSGKIVIRAGQASVRDTNEHVPAPLITARAPEDHP